MPVTPRLLPLLWLLGCEGPNGGCPGLYYRCGLRFPDPDTCGTTETMPIRAGSTAAQVYLHWQDPDGACWPGQSGSPPEGWTVSVEPWCNDSLRSDPGPCPDDPFQ